MSKQAGSLILVAVGLVVAVAVGVAYEVLHVGCCVADVVTGRRKK